MTTPGQLSTPQARMGALKIALEKSLPNIKAVAARHMVPDRIVKGILGLASRNPLILDCTPLSVVKATLQAVELGLEPGSSLGEFYFVPFRNGKTGQREVQGIPGYRGLIQLARRSGEISTITAEAVYEGDEFEVELGLTPKLVHRPDYDNENRENTLKLKFVYAVAHFKDGGYQFQVMSRKQIELIRRRSKAADSGPWVTDYEEMSKKTVIRRLAKYLPLSTQFAQALDLQMRAEIGDFDEQTVIEGEVVAESGQDQSDAPQDRPEPPAASKGRVNGLKAVLSQPTATEGPSGVPSEPSDLFDGDSF